MTIEVMDSESYGDNLATSNTNHKVRVGRNLVGKEVGDAPGAKKMIENEVKVLDALGRWHHWNGNIVITRNLGEVKPASDWQPNDVTLVVEELKKLHRLPREITESSVNQQQLITWRLANSPRDLANKVQPIIDEFNSPLPPSTCLVHGDPHCRNVVWRDGVPSLIDFESAKPGVPEWDYATLWIDLKLGKADPRTVKSVEAFIQNHDSFALCAQSKIARALSWAAYHNLSQGVDERLEIAKEISYWA